MLILKGSSPWVLVKTVQNFKPELKDRIAVSLGKFDTFPHKNLIFASLTQESVNFIYWWSLCIRKNRREKKPGLDRLEEFSRKDVRNDTPCFRGCKRGQWCWWWWRRRDPIVSKLPFGWNRLLVRVLHAPAEKRHHDGKGTTFWTVELNNPYLIRSTRGGNPIWKYSDVTNDGLVINEK